MRFYHISSYTFLYLEAFKKQRSKYKNVSYRLFLKITFSFISVNDYFKNLLPLQSRFHKQHVSEAELFTSPNNQSFLWKYILILHIY